jgi:hypothetical protein
MRVCKGGQTPLPCVNLHQRVEGPTMPFFGPQLQHTQRSRLKRSVTILILTTFSKVLLAFERHSGCTSWNSVCNWHSHFTKHGFFNNALD